ncbi:MAG: hypothetical protein IJW79_02360 [Clostridia bacterium]|nr:hypothetical protein [Clostridia bacterium]
MTITELCTKRAKAWEAAKAFLDSHRTEKGTLSAEDDATYIENNRCKRTLTKSPPGTSSLGLEDC